MYVHRFIRRVGTVLMAQECCPQGWQGPLGRPQGRHGPIGRPHGDGQSYPFQKCKRPVTDFSCYSQQTYEIELGLKNMQKIG